MKLPRLAASLALSLVTALAATAKADMPTLNVGYDSWVGHAGVFIAKEKGFFEKEGVKVELKSFPGPSDTIPPTIAGHLDISLTTPDNVLLVNANQDAGLVNVAFIDASTGADAVVAKNEIKTISDLKGKKIAATLGQCNHLLLLEALAKAGLTENDVNLVNMDGDASGAAFIAGSLDVAVTWEPWVTQITSTGKGHVVFSSKDAPDVIFDTAAVTKKFAAEHPKEIAAFIRGISDGLAYMKEHPEEAQAIVAKTLSSKPEDVAVMLKGCTLYNLDDNLTLFGTPEKPGHVYEALDKVADFQVAHKVYPKKPDVASTLDATFVKSAAAK